MIARALAVAAATALLALAGLPEADAKRRPAASARVKKTKRPKKKPAKEPPAPVPAPAEPTDTTATGTATTTRPGAATGPGAATRPGTGSVSGSGSGTGPGTGSGSGTAPGSGSGSGTVTGTGSVSGSGSGSGSGKGSGSGSGSGTGSGSSDAAAASLEDPDPETPHDLLRPRGRARAARLRLAVDERPFWRRLRYNDDLRGVTRSYDLVANAVGLELAVRPLSGQPGVAVIATGLLAVGVNGSRTRGGPGYATRASEWSLHAGYGGRLGPLQLGARLGYGEHRFRIDDDPAMGPELVPDVTYRWARAGLDVRAALAPRWHLLATAGGRYLLGTGELTGDAWFPRATGHGLDGALGAGFALTRRVSLHARAEVRHYFFAMNPEVGDAMIVGGATDTYLGGAVGAAIELW